MTVLNKKLRRDIVQSRGMLIAIISIVTVGSGLLVGMFSTFQNLNNAKTLYYSQCNMADFWVDLKKVPDSEARQLSKIKGISAIRERICFPVIVDLPNIKRPISGTVLSLPTRPKHIINNIVIMRGNYFSPSPKNEVIISEKFAEARKIKIGSYINLIMNGQKKKLLVVGTAVSSEFVYLTPPGAISPDPMNYGVFWINRTLAENVYGFQNACNSLVGKLTPEAIKNPKPVLNRISRILKPYGVLNQQLLKNQFSNLSLSSELGGLQTMATMLPLIFFAIAALILNVVMLRLAQQQRTVIGTLKAIGIKNNTIFAQNIKYGLIIGLISGISGCFLGYAISAGMISMYHTLFTFPSLTNQICPLTMISAILVSILCSISGTLKGTGSMLKLEPAEAMRPPPPEKSNKSFLENYPLIWSRIGFRWQMVLRGMARNKTRTIAGIISAALGSSIILLSIGMANSLSYMIFFQYTKTMLADYQLSFINEVDNGALSETKQMPGIYYAEPQLNVPCNFIHKQHTKKGVITGIIADSKLAIPCKINGTPVKISSTGIILNKKLADELNISVGDNLTFIPIKGLQRPHDVKVTNIFNTTFGVPVFANYHYLNKLIAESSSISSILLKAQQSSKEKAEFLNNLKEYPSLSSISITEESRKLTEKSFVEKFNGMAYTMIIFAAIIFFASILNSSLISISERRIEIATFRVLGYHNREIGKIFFREIMLINLTGSLIGLPLGYFFLRELCLMFQNQMFSMPCIIYTQTWFITILLSVMFIFSTFFIIQRTINKLNWQDALKIKE